MTKNQKIKVGDLLCVKLSGDVMDYSIVINDNGKTSYTVLKLQTLEKLTFYKIWFETYPDSWEII